MKSAPQLLDDPHRFEDCRAHHTNRGAIPPGFRSPPPRPAAPDDFPHADPSPETANPAEGFEILPRVSYSIKWVEHHGTMLEPGSSATCK